MPKRIITIGGLPGSGKSSTAKGVAKVLGYDHFSSGDLFREIALKRGVTVDELMDNPSKLVDDDVDALVRQKGTENDLVIDSRTAFHWIPDSFKVFLTIDSHIAAKRVYAQIQSVGRTAQEGASVEDVYQKIVTRISNEKKRFNELYNFDYTDLQQYDLIIDTAQHPLAEVIDLVTTAYKKSRGL